MDTTKGAIFDQANTMKIKLSIPSTAGVVGATVLVFFASCDGAKNVACVDSQTNVLFPVSTGVRPVFTQTFIWVSKELQPSSLPSGAGETLLNVIFRGFDRPVTGSGVFVTGSFNSMPMTC